MLDLDRLDALFADGARTLLLTQPHNPLGHVYSRAELEGIRDVVVRHGGRVISDEIHAPLVLPGAEHVPYLSLRRHRRPRGRRAGGQQGVQHRRPALRPDRRPTTRPTRDRLLDVPMARNDSWSVARRGRRGGGVRRGRRLARGAGRRGSTSSARCSPRSWPSTCPQARMRPLMATYLAWLDLRAYDVDDPAAVALAKGRVKLEPGDRYQAGLPGHVRLNMATSPERLTEIVRAARDLTRLTAPRWAAIMSRYQCEGLLRRPDLGLVVDVDQAEALGEALGPLEVVHQRPA